ncbi:TPA: hypothetical protein ACX6PU_001373 [Photobacterium damselae]
MSLINKHGFLLKIIIVYSISIPIGSIFLWVFWNVYIQPIQGSIQPDLIGDPLYFMSIIFGASLACGSCLLFAPIFHIFFMIKEKKICLVRGKISVSLLKKILIFIAFLGGGGAFTSNVILLHKIIPEHGYVLCPKKIGYKKNLLRDYVLELSQCERF